MGKVTTGATMSLDGYIAGPEDTGFDLLFRWYANGDVVREAHDESMSTSTTAEDADHLRELTGRLGALVCGRHLYDLTNGWGGQHPMGLPTVVLTHNPPADRSNGNFHFVSGGIEAAIAKAQELAGGKDVGLNGGQIARQALQAGLLDEIGVDLVPFLLGGGTPFFPDLDAQPYELEQRSCWQSKGVTHLSFTVVRKVTA